MATAARPPKKTESEVKELVFLWEGKNKAGKVVRGEQRASSQTVVQATLRRQGILVSKISNSASRVVGRSPTRISRCLRASWRR
jgi:type IV pilus assembly protein PilC